MLEVLAIGMLRRDADHHQLNSCFTLDRSSAFLAHHNKQSTPCSKLCMGSLRGHKLSCRIDCPEHSRAHQAETSATLLPCGEACSMSVGKQCAAQRHR